MAERCLPRLFGAGVVGNWTKSVVLSLGDGSRMLEMAGGIPAVAVCNVLRVLATAKFIYFVIVFFFLLRHHVTQLITEQKVGTGDLSK